MRLFYLTRKIGTGTWILGDTGIWASNGSIRLGIYKRKEVPKVEAERIVANTNERFRDSITIKKVK